MLSEKMMEDAISIEPEKYLGEKGLRLVARQYSIGSYVFDLLFEDRHGAKLIVELQKGTLDRNHTYKILDYYDEYKENNPNTFIELMVIANKISYERRKRLDSHGISWKEITESKFSNVIDSTSEEHSYTNKIVNNKELINRSKVAVGIGSQRKSSKDKIIPDIYDKIGSILKDMQANIGKDRNFTTEEVYTLYVQRYPEDEEFMEKRKGDSLKGYLNGMVSDYSKYAAGCDSNMPAVQRLAPYTYRFI